MEKESNEREEQLERFEPETEQKEIKENPFSDAISMIEVIEEAFKKNFDKLGTCRTAEVVIGHSSATGLSKISVKIHSTGGERGDIIISAFLDDEEVLNGSSIIRADMNREGLKEGVVVVRNVEEAITHALKSIKKNIDFKKEQIDKLVESLGQ